MFKQITLSAAVCILLMSVMGVTNSYSQDLKIGYVDPQAILSKMPEMKAVQQKIQNFVDRKQQEYAEKEANLRNQVANFEQRSSVISNEAKRKEEERLGQLQADLQQTQTQIQQEIQQRYQELTAPLLQEIQSAIDTVATDMQLTYVINQTTSQGDAIVLYVSEDARQKYDITDQVMRELGI